MEENPIDVSVVKTFSLRAVLGDMTLKDFQQNNNWLFYLDSNGPIRVKVRASFDSSSMKEYEAFAAYFSGKVIKANRILVHSSVNAVFRPYGFPGKLARQSSGASSISGEETPKTAPRNTGSVQCQGTTKKGARCKRMTRSGSYCYQH